MSALAASHAPAERYDPRNAVLDMIEAAVRTAIEHGLEPQLRARVDRLLPPLAAEPDFFGGASDAHAASAPFAPRDANEMLEQQILVGDLVRISKLKMAAPSHTSVARIRERAQAAIDAAKTARGA